MAALGHHNGDNSETWINMTITTDNVIRYEDSSDDWMIAMIILVIDSMMMINDSETWINMMMINLIVT
jgi:hypothetical protein